MITRAQHIEPFKNEKPSEYADRLGQSYASTVNGDHKKKHGQFFTPPEIAHFMVKHIQKSGKEMRILDPGCGTLVLSCALVEHIATLADIHEIDLVAFETDRDLLPYTLLSLEYLTGWCKKRKIKLSGTINTDDFILENRECFINADLQLFNPKISLFNIVISNPPYFKLSKTDKRAIVAKSIVYGQPNIYSIFLIVAEKLLKPGGELIFITPRSFTSGNYFRAFRDVFFREVRLESIHLFGSRTETFNREEILQETLIIKGRKTPKATHDYYIDVSHSQGLKDLAHSTGHAYKADEIIDFHSREKIIHLPVNGKEDRIIKLFKSWDGNLRKYNIQISTGPVVSFRAKKYLHVKPENSNHSSVPLYQLQNTAKMVFSWPVDKKGKYQYVRLCEQTRSILIPNRNYIFLRRFSAKDDKNRLIATPYFADITQSDLIGVENHLNYIYRPNGHMDRNEILGLAALLNSRIFDIYFRTFNGNINVSATELREMSLPPIEKIREIGNELILSNNFSQTGVDEIINRVFERGVGNSELPPPEAVASKTLCFYKKRNEPCCASSRFSSFSWYFM